MTHTLSITYRDGTNHVDELPYEDAEKWDLREMHKNFLAAGSDQLGAIYVIRDAEGREISRYEPETWVIEERRTEWLEAEIGENEFSTAEEAERVVEQLIRELGFWVDEHGRLTHDLRIISSDDEVAVWWDHEQEED